VAFQAGSRAAKIVMAAKKAMATAKVAGAEGGQAEELVFDDARPTVV
jgi:hypothetical protein